MLGSGSCAQSAKCVSADARPGVSRGMPVRPVVQHLVCASYVGGSTVDGLGGWSVRDKPVAVVLGFCTVLSPTRKCCTQRQVLFGLTERVCWLLFCCSWLLHIVEKTLGCQMHNWYSWGLTHVTSCVTRWLGEGPLGGVLRYGDPP
jgi:hypothetical protein